MFDDTLAFAHTHAHNAQYCCEGLFILKRFIYAQIFFLVFELKLGVFARLGLPPLQAFFPRGGVVPHSATDLPT